MRSAQPARFAICLTALVLALAASAQPPAGYESIQALMSGDDAERRSAAETIVAAKDDSLVPGIVDALFFIPRQFRGEALAALEGLTGEERGGYYEWIEYVGARSGLAPRPGYAEWKVSLLERIDPRYRKIIYPGAPLRIRLEEVVSGGVPVAGIPAIVEPPLATAASARYLQRDERVFGVELGRESRAYPLRFLSWHEMLNDVVGGEPVALSYCTLCGSGILYGTRRESGDGRFTLGTSGLLYRSNKLMFDSETLTLWSNLTGEAVLGELAASDVRLAMLPMTLTSWDEWRRRHPDTTVLDLDALKERFAAFGFDYRPGAADRARAGVAFPVWQKSAALPPDAEVYALRIGAATKAYPLDVLLREGVVNDAVGGESLVLVADAESGAVRAYRRGELRFRRGTGAAAALLDAAGRGWRLTEEALIAAGEGTSGEPAERLERVPGHVAFWFGWYGFYPQTEVYRGSEDASAVQNDTASPTIP